MRVAVVAFAALASLCAALPAECNNAGTIPALPAGTNLKQALVYIRHGDRSLADESVCWPNDDVLYSCNLTMLQANSLDTATQEAPELLFRRTYESNREYIPGSCGIGQLTPRGYEQEINNGAAIRQVYINGAGLLPPYLSDGSDKLMYLRSDDVQRTIMSGQALVSGMYPGAFANVTSPNSRALTWLVRDDFYENIYPNPENCPEVQLAYSQAVLTSPESQALYAKYAPLYRTISKIVNRTYVANDNSPLDLFDCVYTHVCHNFALPTGFNDSLAFSGVELASEIYVLLNSYNNSYFAKAGMALLVADSLKALTEAVQGSPAATPFRLYSGHDTGPIIPFLSAFGVWDGVWPTYASMITLELHQFQANTSKYAVRMTYNGDVMKIPGCADSQNLCDFDTFTQIANGIAAYGKSCTVAPAPPSITSRFK